MNRRRMRSVQVTLGLTALVAASLSGCSNDESADYAAVCVNPETQVRVDDDDCDDDREYNGSDSGFFWWYMATRGSRRAPAVGERYNAGDGTYRVSTLRNSAGRPVSVQRGGVDSRGGDVETVARGGFGHGGGGHGGSRGGSGG